MPTLLDTVGACRALWREVPATFTSKTVRFERAYSTPTPVQQRVPIWFGAKMKEELARSIAALGDGWFPLATTPPSEIRAGARVLRDAFVAAGRDPASAGVRAGVPVRRRESGTPDVAAMMEAAAELEGATVLAIPMAGIRSLAEAKVYFEEIVARFRARDCQ
jgi:alkanesulfonate monooxygenase SsuD/methylene tetrahydromethanopterin reductase-like flavin-dependent oxidoreductase (luciferase family)